MRVVATKRNCAIKQRNRAADQMNTRIEMKSVGWWRAGRAWTGSQTRSAALS